MRSDPTEDEIVERWDTGAVTAELSDDETVTALAKALKTDEATVRAALVAAGRIEE